MNDSQIVDQLPREIDVYPMSSIELFERAFCTNFSCCNILFPDLHALLDHYDATSAHSYDCFPSTLTPTPTPLYHSSPASSPPSSPSTHSNTLDASPPHSRPASLACLTAGVPPSLGLPHLNVNLNLNMQIDPSLSLGLNSHLYDSAFVHVLAPLSHPSIYHPDAYALADYLTYEHCYDTATRYLARAFTPTAESCAQSDSQGLGRDPYQGTRMGAGGASKVQCRRAPSPSSPSLSQSSSSSGTEHQYRKKKKRGKADSLGAPLAGTRRRSRKAYQCPIPGCSKSYLNPNGLKYHQEKGKCKIELPVQGRPAAPAPAADVSATTIKEGGKLKKQEALNFWAGTFGNTTASKPLIAPAPTDPNPSTPDEHGVGHDLDCHHQQHMHIHHPQPRPAVLQLPTVHHLGRV